MNRQADNFPPTDQRDSKQPTDVRVEDLTEQSLKGIASIIELAQLLETKGTLTEENKAILNDILLKLEYTINKIKNLQRET